MPPVVLLAAALFVLWPGQALADGPDCCGCTVANLNIVPYEGSVIASDVVHPSGITRTITLNSQYGLPSQPTKYSAGIKLSSFPSATTCGFTVKSYTVLDPPDPPGSYYYRASDGAQTASSTLSAWPLPKENLQAFLTWTSSGNNTYYSIQVNLVSYCSGEPCAESPELGCDTVDDADFRQAPTLWTLTGPGPAIVSGRAVLGPEDAVFQNITLSPGTYTAVISATVTNPVDVDLVLGSNTKTLEVVSSGWNTTVITTTILGPMYTILNADDADSISIDFTCFYSISAPGGACLAPANGTFENDSGWIWYRGAVWRQPAKLAYLPYASKGLISGSASYEFPELDEGQYLLMGFDALGEGSDSGVISSRARSGFNDIVYNYQAFPTFYRYEMDLTGLAGQETHLAFANPGADGIEGIVSSANVELDNICVFVSDRPIQLPYPIDPDAINPIELGFNYTSCDDVDGILAGFGVNIQQYRADYLAGASVWDPIGWVPWLVAAFWNILATYLCIFMATFVTLVDILEYIINNFLNIANWIILSLPAFRDWLALWLQWIGQSLTNLSSSYGNFLSLWADWFGKALVLTSSTIGVTLTAVANWIGQSLVNLSNRLGEFLASWSQWIGQSLANLSNWIGQTLANLWNWLAAYFTSLNGLRALLNWLIDAWNAFLAWLGQTISAILDDGASLWNDILRPFLADIWGYILKSPVSLVGLLIDFLGAVWELLKTMFLWVWHNIISIAHTPLTFYKAFNSGINGSAYNLVTCIGENFWCTFLAGVQLINQLVAHSILYPVFIAGMILSTLVIVWDNFKELFSIDIK